jgi:hypothetical protein
MIPMFRFAAALSAVAALAAAAPTLHASRPEWNGAVAVVIDGRTAPEYRANGTRYVEALEGRGYAIRLHNPFDVRVAVALSVDGLNTIDARHTTASAARKWIIEPHETITISGWQVSMTEARRFFFTTEARSYAKRLGQPDNLGIISAVFFRERRAVRIVPLAQNDVAGESKRQAPPSAAGAQASAAKEEYAATGIGRRTDHPVELVHLELETAPAMSIDIRYEFRAQLARLGVVPAAPGPDDPLARRQNAKGFDVRFCPDIK